jgi:hypothetical protein
MMSEDDQADPKMGPTIAQKFVDAKVAGVVGHLNSGVSIPASAVYNQAGLPMISGSATNPKLTEQGFKVVFRTVGRDDQQGPAVAAYVANELKAKKVAIADDATAYGEGLANEVEKTLKAAGVNVVAREKTNDKATDFKAILTKMKGKSPDVIFYGGMDATGGPMLKQARELGIKATFAYGDGACTSEMSKLAGPASEGMICSQAGIPTQMASKSFQDAFKGEVRRSEAIRAVLLRCGQHPDRRDAEGGLDRPGQVPAGSREDLLRRRDGPHRVRRKGRPQGRRNDDLPDEGWKRRAGRHHQGGKTTKIGPEAPAAAAATPARPGSARQRLRPRLLRLPRWPRPLRPRKRRRSKPSLR